MNEAITTYNNNQANDRKQICEVLARAIHNALPENESKIWHGHPVWFSEGNPIVGYDVLKDSIRLLFWSGQSFDEPGLDNEGSFKAAEVRYTSPEQIDETDLQRWLKKSVEIQWDYKNIVKNKGMLNRLK